MVVADLKMIYDYKEEDKFPMKLCASMTFDGDRLKMVDGKCTYPDRYQLMMHMRSDIQGIGISQAMVYEVSRHIVDGEPQYYKHIDANYLSCYSDNGFLERDLRELEFIKSSKEGMWFHSLAERFGSVDPFEEITASRRKVRNRRERKVLSVRVEDVEGNVMRIDTNPGLRLKVENADGNVVGRDSHLKTSFRR